MENIEFNAIAGVLRVGFTFYVFIFPMHIH